MTSRQIVFRPQARAELLEAQDWYEDRIAGLGREFARAVDAAVAAIRRHPESFTVVEEPYRQCVMRRFPYSLVYRATEEAIIIVAVHHQRRHPDHWRAPG